MRGLLLALLLLPAAAEAQRGRRRETRPRIPDNAWAFSDCPLDVEASCRAFCTQGAAAETCPWRAFGCDFRVCWGTRQRSATEELQLALDDPAAYRLPGSDPASPANLVSVVRLSETLRPALYLARGEFVVDLPQLMRGEAARRFLRYAQACVLTVTRAPTSPETESLAAAIAASPRSERVYTVGCDSETGRAGMSPWPDLTPERLLGAVQHPAREPSAGPSAVIRPVPQDPARTRQLVRQSEIQQMSNEELASRLQMNERVRVDGNGRISIHSDGQSVLPYDRRTSPESRARALRELSEEEFWAFQALYKRTANRVLREAEQRSPPPAGQHYRYDDYSGRADLEPDEESDAASGIK